jgi:hypothetical protein
VRRYLAILGSVEKRFPHGSLLLLNRARLARYRFEPQVAINILMSRLGPTRMNRFLQVDALLVFETAWLLLTEGRYEESG